MSDGRYHHPLRRQGLPVALACVLAASLGGCASFRMSDLGFGASQAACRSDTWPTQVMGSVQHADTQPDIPEPVVDDGPGRVAEYSFTDDSSGPVAESSSEPVAEQSAEPVEQSPRVVVEENSSVSEPAAEASPSDEPQSAAPQPPPVTEPPTPEPPQDVIAKLPEPVAPPPPPSTPEVVEVCGATDKACQDQLTALLADPMHKWIKAKPTSRDEPTGVRILAYRVLTPVLACEDLRRGLQETQAATASSGAAQPEATEEASKGAAESGRSLEWVQLLRRAVELELKAEIEKRC